MAISTIECIENFPPYNQNGNITTKWCWLATFMSIHHFYHSNCPKNNMCDLGHQIFYGNNIRCGDPIRSECSTKRRHFHEIPQNSHIRELIRSSFKFQSNSR